MKNKGVFFRVGQRVIIKDQDAIRLLKHIRKLSDGLSKLVAL